MIHARIRFSLVIAAVIILSFTLMTKALDWSVELKKSMPQADKFTRLSDIEKYRKPDVPMQTVKAVFPAYKGSLQVGVVIYVAPYGYKSDIHTLVAFNMSGAIQKAYVFAHDETPSYVVQLDNGTYQAQFSGITLSDKLALIFGDRPSRRGEVQAITNATPTSKAVAIGVSEARRMFAAIYSN